MRSSSFVENNGEQCQSPIPQLVIEPPGDDFYDEEDDDEEPKEAVDILRRYFHWGNILVIIISLGFSGGVIFHHPLQTWFWKITAPEETSEYLLNLKSCKIPNLYDGTSELPFIWDLDMSRTGNLEHVDFNCESIELLAEVQDEQLFLMAKNKKRKCCFRNFTRPDVLEGDLYRLSSTCIELSTNGTNITESEFLLVQCIHSKNKSFDFSAHALIPNKPSAMEKTLYWSSNYSKNDQLPFNVAIIVIASTSRAQAYRSLPETMKYLEGDNAHFTIMNGYQSIEDNLPSASLTANNILPLLTGMTDPAKEVKWPNRWDNYSMLWTKFSDEKYVTMFIDDSRKMLRTTHGNLNRPKAFKKQPTDYYIKPLMEAHIEAVDSVYKNKLVAKRHCFGKRTITSYFLRHLSRFHKKFEKVPTFSFTYLTWPQQPYGLEALSKMDHTYSNFFKEFLSMPQIKERTAVVVMSDQGGMNHPYFKTEHGSLEKLNPLLMIRLPEALIDKHPKFLENLKMNSHRVVSPIDVHRTIAIFPKIFTEKEEPKSVFSIESNSPAYTVVNEGKLLGKNLFVNDIPHDRTCEDAFIPAQMCLCNKSVPHNFNGRVILEDGHELKYWRYVALPK